MLQPQHHRRAEARDHHLYADRDRDRDHQRSDRHSGAALRTDHIARSQPPQQAEESREWPPQKSHQHHGDQRCQRGQTKDHSRRSAETDYEVPRGNHQNPRTDQSHENAKTGGEMDHRLCFALQPRPGECQTWRHGSSFPGRRRGSQQACQETGQTALNQARSWNLYPTYIQDEVKIVDGLRDHLHRALAEQDAQSQPDERAQRADQCRLTQDHHKNLLPRIANAPQCTKDRTPLDHGEGHGVIDEEESDYQRQQAEGRQVDLECFRHFHHLAVAQLRRDQLRPRWELRGEGF